MARDLDFGDLEEVRRRVVEPVLRGLFKPGELRETELHVGHPFGAPPSHPHDAPEIWFRAVDADGEIFIHRLGKASPERGEAGRAAADLASALEDLVCESRYGWGEKREAVYEVPPPLRE